MIGSNTVLYPTYTSPVVTIGGQAIYNDPSAPGSAIVISGDTLTVGQVTTIDGTLVSVGSGVVVIASSTVALRNSAVTGSSIAPAQAHASSLTQLIIGGSTLLPGSTLVMSGTTYSLPATRSGVYANGVYYSTPTGTPSSPFTIGSIVATPSVVLDVVIGGHTLLPGSALTLSGTTYSLPASGTGLVVYGVSDPLPAPTDGFGLTIGGAVYAFAPTLMSGTEELIVGTRTLAPGSVITLAGETLSLGPLGLVAASDGHTTTYPLPTVAAYITLGPGEIIPAYVDPVQPGDVVMDGTTLSVGGLALIEDGRTISLGQSGLIVDGTKTVPLTLSLPTISSSGTAEPSDGGNNAQLPSTSTQSSAQRLQSVWAAVVCAALCAISVL